MANEVVVEIVRDRCRRCGEAREAIFDLGRGTNTAAIPYVCKSAQACADEMAHLYLTFGKPGRIFPRADGSQRDQSYWSSGAAFKRGTEL